MASWSALIALSGYHYSGVDRKIQFTAVPGKYFWSNGYAWGLCEVSADKATLSVLKGTLNVEYISIGDKTKRIKGKTIRENESVTIKYD